MRKTIRWLLMCWLMSSMLLGSAFAVTENGSLCYGDHGDEVTRLQTALKGLGYSIGTIDGSYGAYTENAVRKFQKKYGLTVDGIAGETTQAKIYAAYEKKTGTSSIAAATATSTSTTTSTSAATTTVSDGSFFGGDYTTIRAGVSASRIKQLQNALNTLGYSCGAADGTYGTKTREAVKAFQKAQKLTADGVAGKATLKKMESVRSSQTSATQIQTTTVTTTASTTTTTGSTTTSTVRTLRSGMSGDDVKSLQQALKTLGYYKGSVDGKYGSGTVSAVKAFQKAQKLTADGIAGAKTIAKLNTAASANMTSGTSTSSSSTSASTSSSVKVSVGQIKLLHWFNDIKPTLKTGQTILVYEPTSGISWTLKLYSLGRHADCEPLTKEDTENMVKAFGGENTWNQKAVYVKLPSGTWTLASTHDMPHMSGSISDNGFNGHLCVHFLRDMDEAKKNDPNYGVSNQNTIRAAWKALTGETVE